jgi:pimeloyl-ACP methyl ester carboxylesterase
LDLYFDTGGARLRYRDEGRGPAVILVHGWTLDLDQWELQSAALAPKFRIVRLDRRGFGLSTGSPSTAADGADLLALYAHLGLESAALLGMSQGARVALQFAKSYPQLTSCAIFDGPPYFGPADAADISVDLPYQHYRELAQGEGLAAFRREWSQHALVRLRTEDPIARALLERMIARYPGRDLLEPVGPSGTDPAQNFESLDRPALVMSGEFDLDSRKRFARQLASQLPQGECVEIPDAGHLSNFDNPGAYNQALRRFLELHAAPFSCH